MLVTLVALTGLLLLLAAVNIGGQLLARAADREPELAIRTALGASRWRIARQLLIEGWLLSIVGVAVALPFAWWGSRALGTALWNSPTPMTAVVTPDLRVLIVIGLLSLAAGLVVGLLPAWSVRQSAPSLPHGRGLVRGRSRWTGGLLVAQVAISVVLVFGGLLLARTLARLQSIDLGYDARTVVSISLRPLPGAYRDLVYASYYPDLLRRVSELPGVQAASYSRHFGFTRFEDRYLVPVVVDDGGSGAREATAWMDPVAPGFFATLGVPLLQGRDVTWQDTPDTPPAVLINQQLASRLFPEGGALGRRIRFGSFPSHRALEVVGVVGNVSYGNARAADVPMIYRPALQEQVLGRYPTLVVRGEGNLASLSERIRETVEGLGREHVQTSASLGDYATRGVARERIAAAVSALAALLAAFLAFIGLFSLSAHGVARRTREIGIRMAVAPIRRTVRQMIVGESLLLIGLGVAIGVPAAIAASGLIASLLFAVTPADPATLMGTAGFFILVGIAASVIPAGRAATLDSASALRAE